MCKMCLDLDQSNIKILEFYSELYESSDETLSLQMLEKAWNMSDQSMPHIGFKLAKTYYEKKMFVQCIDICNHIQYK